jgi:fermentation-respiration switch protein FrsA (DUF1100 family)
METLAKEISLPIFGNMKSVSFNRDGLRIAGHLFTPADFDEGKVYPALVVNGAVSMIKEQAPDNYAKLLVQQGFVILTFDYISYGESEGTLRQNENVLSKFKDFQASITYLSSLPYVGKIGAVGICVSGGNVAYLAANDERISAVASVIPWMYEPALAEIIWGNDEIRRRDNKAKYAWMNYEYDREYLSTQIFTNSPEVEGFMLGDAEYFFDKRRALSLPTWKNEIFWGAWSDWAHVYDPISQAPKIKVPALVFSSDDALLPAQAKKFFEAVTSEKELVWGKGYHFNFYDKLPHMTQVIEAVVPFMDKHLA